MNQEKAVAVARDVLAHLVTLRLEVNYYAKWIDDPMPLEGDLQDCVGSVEANCEVCAIGAAILSKARLYNKVDARVFERIERYANTNLTREVLEDIFASSTLDLIEAAFEKRIHHWMWNTPEIRLQAAVLFGKRRKDLRRLVHDIYTNIIKHDGFFFPEDDGPTKDSPTTQGAPS